MSKNPSFQTRTYACVCESAKEVDAEIPLRLTRCCNPSEKLFHSKSGNLLECDRENENKVNITCSHPSRWQKYDWKHDDVEFDNTTDEITFGNKRKRTKNAVHDKYCVGVGAGTTGRLEKIFMNCHTPCNGTVPCFR